MVKIRRLETASFFVAFFILAVATSNGAEARQQAYPRLSISAVMDVLSLLTIAIKNAESGYGLSSCIARLLLYQKAKPLRGASDAIAPLFFGKV
jgi:hypothetical protein